VVLATGGFQNNPEMKTKYFGPYGDQAVARSVPTNDGTGMLMAQDLGAKLSKSLGSFYGHSVAAPPFVQVPFMEFYTWGSQYHDNHSLFVNLDGERFCDEGKGVAGDLSNESLVRQRWGRACLVFDQAIYDKFGSVSASGTKMLDRTKEVISRGGRVAQANTIEELASKIAAWGYHPGNFIKTVKEYDAAVAAGKAGEMRIPRTAEYLATVERISTPPFYATEIVGGISCCYGGLAIDGKTQVLKARDDQPIPGLYAAPGTAGGVAFVHYYLSSLGALAGFGWIAGNNAAAYAKALR
jgi:succinate dehydrogenase/fumarate reductase flavoprotein subunit